MEITKENIIFKKEFANSIVNSNNVIKITENTNQLQSNSYQLFVKNFINPNTQYARILVNHETGTGKTITALNTGLEFIKLFKQNKAITNEEIGNIIIIGFTKHLFKNELLSRQEYGILTNTEIQELKGLAQITNKSPAQVAKLKELRIRYSKRIRNRNKNGYYKFFGYKELFNKLLLFGKDIKIDILTETTILNYIKTGQIKINIALLNIFKNSLVVCDEIHNVWNSFDKNNWGISLQIIMDYYSKTNNIRLMMLTATPLTNSPLEIISLINLLVPVESKIKKFDIFDENNDLTKFGADRIRKILNGRVSYVQGRDLQYFPSKQIVGELIDGIDQLRFIRCEMSKFHFDTYRYESLEESNNTHLKKDDNNSDEYNLSESIKSEMKSFPVNLSLYNRYLMDYALPNPESKVGLFKSNTFKQVLLNADNNWLEKNKISVDPTTMTISGNFLLHENMKSYSSKYYILYNYIKDIVKNRQGKILIFHQYVSNSGILFVAEFLKTNGFLSDQDSEPVSNTLCSLCFSKMSEHNEKTKHVFKPLRYAIAYGDISKKQVDESLANFNIESNKDGDNIKILIGSRFIKEGFDFKAIRHLFILHMPDNISTLMQIFGRGIRKNSHAALPIDQRIVKIYIMVSSLPKELNDYSFEELLYKKKLQIHSQIQLIEDIIHKNAIDNYINANINVFEENIMETKLIPYEYHPLDISKLETHTFNAFYINDEIEYIKSLIIKLFIHVSPYFEYKYLLQLVKSPPFNVNRNNTIITEGMFLIAINYLINNQTNRSFVNKNNITVTITGPYKYDNNTYYITKEVNSNSDFNDFNKIGKYVKPVKINVNDYISKTWESNSKDDEINTFLDKYKDDTDLIYVYDIHFQKILIENIIKYFMNPVGTNKYDDMYKSLLKYYLSYNIFILNDSKLPLDIKKEFSGYDKIPVGYNINYESIFFIDNSFIKHKTMKHKQFNDAKIIGIQTIDNNMVKFKIKENNKTKHKDLRLLEKGIVCKFKSKDELNYLIKALNIKSSTTKKHQICKLIEQELISREIAERKMKTNVKWFYFLSDQQ